MKKNTERPKEVPDLSLGHMEDLFIPHIGLFQPRAQPGHENHGGAGPGTAGSELSRETIQKLILSIQKR